MSLRSSFLKQHDGKTRFIHGDEAAAWGAVYANCSFFGGYPITPASEIAEVLSELLPQVGGYYVQFEDEIASISALIGAAWAGGRALTATSGPGYSLMQENLGHAVMTETPIVIIDVQRSGPSTGQATKPAQGDLMQARWGTHGDHDAIALSPWSAQECLDLTIRAFDLSEKYRMPVTLLMDGEIGHLRERVTFPSYEELTHYQRPKAGPQDVPWGGPPVPPMIEIGDGRDVHITGSTHRADGIRDVESQPVHDVLIRRQVKKIETAREEVASLEEHFTDDAEAALVSWGGSARPSYGAALALREKGLKVGFMRLITMWPFPRRQVAELGQKVKKLFVPEMNLGQLNREIERFVNIPVLPLSKIGGIVHTIDELCEVVEKNL